MPAAPRNIEPMEVNTKLIRKGDLTQEQGPFIRSNLVGSGCGLDGCDCSPDYFIAISDGVHWLSVTLSANEAAAMRVRACDITPSKISRA